MYPALCISSFIAGIAGVICIGLIVKKDTLKKRNGTIIVGKKIGCKELPGRPTRYITEVEFEVNHTTYKKKVITADKRISTLANNGQINLIYVDQNNSVYWADDKSNEIVVWIIVLSGFCALMFLCTVIGSFAHTGINYNNANEETDKDMNTKMTVWVGGWDCEYTTFDRTLTLEDFESIQLGSSLDEIEGILGEPNGWTGSGILSPFYVLQDGSAVRLTFNVKGPYKDLSIIELYKGQEKTVLKKAD